MTANDGALLMVREGDELLADDPERALELYRGAYALLVKAGDKHAADYVRRKKVMPLAVKVFAK